MDLDFSGPRHRNMTADAAGWVLVEGGTVATVTDIARFPQVDDWLHEVRQHQDPQGGGRGAEDHELCTSAWH